MAYQNVNFPTMKLIQGFKVDTVSPTVIVGNYAKEYRYNRFVYEKRIFTFPGRNMKYADWVVINSFLDNVGWMRDSFNLTRPDNGSFAKVRLAEPPSMQVVSLFANNTPNIVFVSDIQLVEVTNE